MALSSFVGLTLGLLGAGSSILSVPLDSEWLIPALAAAGLVVGVLAMRHALRIDAEWGGG